MTKDRILMVVRAVCVVLVLAAIVAQALELANAGVLDPTRFFAFFTIQSNLIGVAAFAWLLARPPAIARVGLVPRGSGRLPDRDLLRRHLPVVGG